MARDLVKLLANDNLGRFIEEVERMMDLQQTYFRTKQQPDLVAARQQEQYIRGLMARYRAMADAIAVVDLPDVRRPPTQRTLGGTES